MVECFASKITSSSGGLQLKIEFLEDEMEAPQDGLLTPISTEDNRLPSLTSCSWAFSHPTPTAFHPLSAQSSQEPSTPPGLGFPPTILAVRSDATGYKTNMSPHNLQSPLSLRKESKVAGLDLSAPDWLMPCNNHYSSQPYGGMGPMAASYGVSSNLIHKSPEEAEYLAGYNKPWASSTVMQSSDVRDPYRCDYHGSQTESYSMAVPALENLGHWALPGNEVEPSTIVPAQTMVDANSTMSDGSFQDSSFQGSGFSSPARQVLKDMATFYNIRQQSDGFEPSRLNYLDASPPPAYRSIGAESSFDFKDARRHCRASRITKRRNKPQQLTELIKILPAGKRHECYFKYQDGTVCKKKFQRVEHLRRHIYTHTGGSYVFCPVPECKKNTEGFGGGRKDNLRQHFKTHLRQTSTSRNDRRSFKEFYSLLRQSFSEEEAEKSIAKLEEWRLEGGHLKSGDGSVGKGGGTAG